MVNTNKAYQPGIRAALLSGLFLVATSASAVSITIDGDIIDLTDTIGASSYNFAVGNDPLGNSDNPVTENNNGFDISNAYAYYDTAGTGTLYLGLSVYGTVGDSRAISDTTSTTEIVFGTAQASNNRSIFDSNESYRFELFKGTTTLDPSLLKYTVTGIDGGGSYVSTIDNPNGLTIVHAVSETFNGVEFMIEGLNPYLIPYGFSNPRDLLIFFGAESLDPNPVSNIKGDTHLLQMQVVPVPAAIWLFGSGLAGLIGFSARKNYKRLG